MKKRPHSRAPRPRRPPTDVANVADLHRAEQDSRARLSARRDHGPADVRRSHLHAADGGSAVAGDRQPDGSDAGLVHRPRDHAALDARRAQYGDHRRAASCLRRRRACSGSGGITAAISRAACSFSTTGSSWCGAAPPTRTRQQSSSSVRIVADEPIPGFGHRFHTRDPRAARLFQMALELEIEAEHIQMIRAVEIALATAGKDTRCR